MAVKKRKKSRFEFLTRKFPLRMQRKLVMLFMAVVLAFVVLIGRITYINVTKGSKYTKVVLDQQNYDSRVIAFKRGDIVDRNGTKMATSERVYNVILDVAVMMDKKEYIEPTKEVLKECFNVEGDVVDKLIKESPDSRYEVLVSDVDYATAQKFKKIDEDDKKYPNVKGIWLEEDYLRSYPYGSMASDVLGFVYGGNQGALGIESAYNSILNGTDGREYGYFDSDSSVERTVKPAKNGNTVVSTIDVTLQNIVEKCILEFNSAHAADGNPGSKNTAVIIMNPNTGEILAEASYPNFDLNDPRNLSLLYTKEQWDAMSEEDQVEAMNDLWRNFCVSDAYEPGSTAKPFTVAAGLETGTLTGNESYYCGGSKDVLGTKISCHYKSGHGQETIQDAIANSCNVALMDMAAVIGPENFTKYQHIFGFGEYTGIDLPGEAETSGLLYEPHVVKQIQDEDGNVIETKDPVLLRKTVSSETSKMLRQYLKATMDYGTGTRAKVEGYDIGAKTGTAEKLPRGNGKYLLSYIGYAPQNNPEVVVYVVIDEPNTAVQDDSSLVLGLSQKIMSEAFPYLGITTIAQSGQNAQAQGQNFGNTEYTDYDENYEDTYGNADGS